MTISEDINELEEELKETELQLDELRQTIEKLEEELEIDAVIQQDKSNRWRNDPDPYDYHGIPLTTRLREMGYVI